MISAWKWTGFFLALAGSVLIGYGELPDFWEGMRKRFCCHLDLLHAQTQDLFLPWTRFSLALAWLTSLLVVPGCLLLSAHKPWFALISFVPFLIFPTWFMRWFKKYRSQRFHDQLVDILTALTNGMRSGLSLQTSMRMIVEEMPSPGKEEFGLVLKAHEMGESLETAMHRLLDRMPSEEISMFVSSIRILRKVGGDLPSQFDMVIKTIQKRQQVEGKIRTLTAQGRYQTIAIALIGLGFFLGLWFVSPDMIQPLLHSLEGRICLSLSGTLFLLGILAMRRLAQINV